MGNLTSTSRAYSDTSYIIERNPGKYGGEQEDYVEKSQTAIESASNAITTGVSEKKELTTLFIEVLEDLGHSRANIARMHKTIDVENFGQKRGFWGTPEMEEFKHGALLGNATLLHVNEYSAYQLQFLERLKSLLRPILVDHRGFSINSVSETKTVCGYESRFDVQILNRDAVIRFGEIPRIEELNSSIKIPGSYPKSNLEFINSKMAMIALKTMNPELYNRLRLSYSIQMLMYSFPGDDRIPIESDLLVERASKRSLKSHYIVATNYLVLDGKPLPMSQYLTWVYCNGIDDPLERMVTDSKVLVMHQDILLVAETLKEISKIFKEVISWNRDKESVEELKNNVALLRYALSHNMPFHRGSAAIGEWLETAMYRYHGFDEFHHTATHLTDLEALTSLTLEDFMNSYEKTMTLG